MKPAKDLGEIHVRIGNQGKDGGCNFCDRHISTDRVYVVSGSRVQVRFCTSCRIKLQRQINRVEQ